MTDKCEHKRVVVFSRTLCIASYYEPSVVSEWAKCRDCGCEIEIEDIPEDAEESEGETEPRYRGAPSEFYD